MRGQHAAFSRLVYGRLREALGGRCEFAVSGGAPLGERLGHFYRGIGLTVLEGYGLTETTGALTVNLPDAIKIGRSAVPFRAPPCRWPRTASSSSAAARSSAGYWRNDAASSEVLEGGGWFHTGDVGEIDDEGFVRITGRKKEILVTAGGKNVAPAALEDRIRAHPLVDQCLVVGDGRPFIAALVPSTARRFRPGPSGRARRPTSARSSTTSTWSPRSSEAVDDANKAVSKAESIRKFRILADEWTEEGGQLTPSLKLKRNVVLREARDEVGGTATCRRPRPVRPFGPRPPGRTSLAHIGHTSSSIRRTRPGPPPYRFRRSTTSASASWVRAGRVTVTLGRRVLSD